MAAVNPPDYIQASSHGADAFRRALKALRAQAGVVATGDMLVAQNGTPNMSVNVAAGQAVIDGTENALTQGSYVVLNDAVVNLVIAAADATNPRYDLVVAKVQDAFYSGATNAWSLAVVTGTPAGSPVDPAVPANSITLARVVVAALATTIVNANITDRRLFVNGAALNILGVGSSIASHITATGTVPSTGTVNAGISAGPTVVGNDTHGIITFTVGAGTIAANSALFTVIFATTYASTPTIVVGNMTLASVYSGTFTAGSPTGTNFVVTNTALMGIGSVDKVGYVILGA